MFSSSESPHRLPTHLVLDPLLDPLDHGVGGLAEVGLVPLE